MRTTLLACLLFCWSGWLLADNPPVALPDGADVPNFTLTDLDGVTHTLYDYLDQGKTVVLDFSATWCGPCWNYHNTHILGDLHNQYGPNGTDEVMVFFIEADPSTPVSSLYGGPGSQGNWVAGTPYPIMDDGTGSVASAFAITYFPTLYAVCPNRKIYEPGQVALQTWVNWISSCSLDENSTAVDSDCFNDPSGSIDLTVTGGYGNISYNWSNGATTEDLSNLAPGTYSCTITEGNGHTVETNSIIVNSPPPLVPQTNYVIDVLCSGESTGAAGVGAVGGMPGYTFEWSNGETGPTLADVPAGVYSVTVTDGNDCEEIHPVVIGEPSPLFSAPSTTGANCGNSDGTLLVMPQGGTFPYLFDIGDGPQPSPIFIGLPAGDYDVVVYDAAGCTFDMSANVPDIPGPTADAGPAMQVDCFNTTVELDGSASDDGVAIAYLWTTADGNIVSGETTSTPEVDQAGTYTLEVLDQATNCLTTATVTVTENFSQPTADALTNEMITCTTTEITLDGSGSSQGANFTYTWTTSDGVIVSGENTINPIVAAAGTYEIEVLDLSNGCTSTETVVVNEDINNPLADGGQDEIINCLSASVVLDGSASDSGPNISYSWSTTDGIIVSGTDAPMVEVAAAGTYVIDVIDQNNGCIGTDVVIVTEDLDVPTADGGTDGLLTCANIQVTLDGSGSSGGADYNYTWTTPDGNIVSGENSTNPVVDAPGTYTIEVYDSSNGCISTDEVVVTQDIDAPLADAGPQSYLTCETTSLELDGTGSDDGANITYIWTTPDGNIVEGEDTDTPTIDAPGTYTIEVYNTDNDCVSSSSVFVELVPPVVGEVDVINDADCAGEASGSATVTTTDGTAPFTYAWPTGGTGATESGLEAGTYVVTITDDFNCSDEVTVVVNEPSLLIANASATGESSAGANDGTASASPNGGTGAGYTFLWSNGETTATITGLEPGTYTVLVTDENNCTVEETVTVNAFSCAIGADINSIDVSCNGGTDGEATVSIFAGAEPFNIEWSSGGTGVTETGLEAGTYTVSITDDNNCPTTANVTINEPEDLTLDLDSSSDVSCNGDADGTATVLADGGTPGYSYLWSNDIEGPIADGLEAGTYEVVVTDDNGCTETVEVVVDEPAILDVTIDATNESGNGAEDGTATADPAGGTPGYTYLWNTGSTEVTITDLAPGEYTVEVTDNNGCVSTQSVIILAFACGNIEAITEVDDVSCAGEGDGIASVSLDGGSAPYTYQWSNNATTQTVENLTPGAYTVTVTDDNDCPVIADVIIEEPSVIGVQVVDQVNVSCTSDPVGSVSVEASGGNEDFTYTWSNGMEGPAIEDLEPGMYTVTATDVAGCEQAFDVEILFFPDDVVPEVVTQDLQLSLDPQTGMVSITPDMIDNGSADDCGEVALALDQLEFTCDHVGTQTVTLTVTDQAGNESTGTATVEVMDNLPTLVVASPQMVVLDPVTGMATLDESALIVEASDDCGVEMITFSQLEVGCDFVGGGTVEVTLLDVNGHLVTETIEVFAADETAPTMNCPENIVTADCDMVIEYETVVAEDNCGIDIFVQTLGVGSGNVFPEGTTVEEYFAVDSHGNETVCTFLVTVENSLALTTEATPTCPDMEAGIATVLADGGTPGYTYNWSNGGTTAEIIDLAPGNYDVTVTDDLGCERIESVVVESTPEVIIEIISVTNETNDDQNGAIDIELTGGIDPLTVTWYDENQNPVSGNVDLMNMPAGIYTPVIVDGFGCTYTTGEPIVIQSVTGVSDIQSLVDFELSPNPTQAQCQLKLQLSEAAQIDVLLYDLNGRLLQQHQAGYAAQLNLQIDLADQPSGVYLMKLHVGDQWLTERIVLMD